MVKALRKIELMHQQFGVVAGKTCGECSNLTEHRYDKLYRKCKIYGETSSEATDWAMRWTACGKWMGSRCGLSVSHRSGLALVGL